MKNISEAVSQIKAINPNAEVIVQNIYQPLQIDKNFISKQFPGTIGTAIGTLRQLLEDVLSSSNSFKSELNALAASDGFKVADVYTDFTSQEEGVMKSADAPGHASYFVDIATDDIKNNADIHPNQIYTRTCQIRLHTLLWHLLTMNPQQAHGQRAMLILTVLLTQEMHPLYLQAMRSPHLQTAILTAV